METFDELPKFFVLNMSNIRDIVYTVFTSKERCKPDFSLSKQKLCHRNYKGWSRNKRMLPKKNFLFR